MREWIYGRNAVYETLKAGKRLVYRLRIAEHAQMKGRLAEILHEAELRKLKLEHVKREQLEPLGPGHQGIALEAGDYTYSALPDMLDLARFRKEPPFLLLLDTLQDIQNLGTLLRTAEAVGVHGVLLPLRRTATITPAVVNASSGASEHLLIGQANLAQSIERLKEENVWIVGLQGELPAQEAPEVRLDGALALVVGSEGEGMRELTRKSCDILMKLPMRGKVESLNAAVAGSVALYLAYMARSGSDK
jgi:23S rRNA (guanosine2251-2'-O)-methyltransferase